MQIQILRSGVGRSWERERGIERGRDERTRIIRCLADSLWILAIISAVRFFGLFSSPPSAGFVTFCGSLDVVIRGNMWRSCWRCGASWSLLQWARGLRSQVREREREEGERGVWIKSGSTLVVSFESTFFPLAPALFQPLVTAVIFIVAGDLGANQPYWPESTLRCGRFAASTHFHRSPIAYIQRIHNHWQRRFIQ